MRNWMLPLEEIKTLFQTPLFQVGDTSISIATLLLALAWMVGVFLFAGIFRKRILRRVLTRTALDLNAQYLISRFASYFIIFLGILVGLPMLGIDLTSVTLLMGALGVGIGFGLQNIASNFVSGFIILLSRPIKLGDRVEFGQISGDVVAIKAYHSTIRTNDNIEIIVPNAQVISGPIINWSHHEKLVRFRIPITVAYDSDPFAVRQALLDVASGCEHVLRQPEPNAVLKQFGEAGMEFELRVWTSTMLHRPGVLRSQINFGVWKTFKERGIRIPYPQRDLHIKSMPGGPAPLPPPPAAGA